MLTTGAFIVGAVALTGTFISFWLFGHRGVWGRLANKYKDESPIYKGFFRSEIIYVRQDDGWRQWSFCSITLSDSGLRISQPPFISLLVPSLSIPYKDISIDTSVRPWFKKQIILKFEKLGIELAIAASHKKQLEKLGARAEVNQSTRHISK